MLAQQLCRSIWRESVLEVTLRNSRGFTFVHAWLVLAHFGLRVHILHFSMSQLALVAIFFPFHGGRLLLYSFISVFA